VALLLLEKLKCMYRLGRENFGKMTNILPSQIISRQPFQSSLSFTEVFPANHSLIKYYLVGILPYMVFTVQGYWKRFISVSEEAIISRRQLATSLGHAPVSTFTLALYIAIIVIQFI